MGMTEFQGGVIDALNAQDLRNQDLLDQVIGAANAISNSSTTSDITMAEIQTEQDAVHQDASGRATRDYDGDGVRETGDQEKTGIANNAGSLRYGGKNASLQGTGGVALLEYAKDAIQTAVGNISGMGVNQMTARKIVERKMGGNG